MCETEYDVQGIDACSDKLRHISNQHWRGATAIHLETTAALAET
jgi:hypothetical protein